MLFIVARSMSEGRAAGIVSALGIFTGTIVHMLAVALGLAGLLAAVPAAYDVVRYVGAAYLLYLGFQALRHPGPLTSIDTPPAASLGTIFRQAVVTNVL